MINDLSCKGFRFRRSGKVFASRENFASEFRNAAFGIRNPAKFKNLESKFKQRLESSTWNLESRIQDCIRFSCKGRIAWHIQSTVKEMFIKK